MVVVLKKGGKVTLGKAYFRYGRKGAKLATTDHDLRMKESGEPQTEAEHPAAKDVMAALKHLKPKPAKMVDGKHAIPVMGNGAMDPTDVVKALKAAGWQAGHTSTDTSRTVATETTKMTKDGQELTVYGPIEMPRYRSYSVVYLSASRVGEASSPAQDEEGARDFMVWLKKRDHFMWQRLMTKGLARVEKEHDIHQIADLTREYEPAGGAFVDSIWRGLRKIHP